MAKKHRFVYEFDDAGPNSLSFAVTDPPSEKAMVTIENDMAVLYINKPACRVLAEVFASLAEGSYNEGFHIHLHEHFDSDRRDMLRIVLALGDGS